MGEFAEGLGGGIGEGGAEAEDGLEGVPVVDDDGGRVFIGFIERGECGGAVVGEEFLGGGFGGGEFGGEPGRRGRGGGDVDVGFAILAVIGGGAEEGKEERCGSESQEEGAGGHGGRQFKISDLRFQIEENGFDWSYGEGAGVAMRTRGKGGQCSARGVAEARRRK